MSFVSWSTGLRPDILDTDRYKLEPTPLTESQMGVEWTHCLGGIAGSKYLLLVEKHQGGIYPGTLENYLNWLLPEDEDATEADADTMAISIEAEPGEAFLARLNSLDRVSSATYRVVRPNPGWNDLQSELGTQAAESHAHKADITMTSRRGRTLSRVRGIVNAIRAAFQNGVLDFAKIEGERSGAHDAFNTEQLGAHTYMEFQLDTQGQVDHSDAWRKLNEFFRELH